MLLNAYRHHHTQILLIFSIYVFVYVYAEVCLCDLFSLLFSFQNNRIIPLKQTIVFLHVLFSFSQKFSSGLAFDYFLANFYLVLPVKVLLMKVCNEVLTFCSYLRDKKSRKTLFWMMKIDSIILETIISH